MTRINYMYNAILFCPKILSVLLCQFETTDTVSYNFVYACSFLYMHLFCYLSLLTSVARIKLYQLLRALFKNRAPWCEANRELEAWGLVGGEIRIRRQATVPLFKSPFSPRRDSYYPAGFESPALGRTSSFLWHWQLDSSRYSRRVTDFSFPREFSYRRLWDERYPTAPSLSSSTRLDDSKYRPRKEGSLRRASSLSLAESDALFQISFSLIHAQGKEPNELSMETRMEGVVSRYRYLVFWQIVSQTRHIVIAIVRDNASQ